MIVGAAGIGGHVILHSSQSQPIAINTMLNGPFIGLAGHC
jgi:hypothetical protein